jgi:hypothetical protein
LEVVLVDERDLDSPATELIGGWQVHHRVVAVATMAWHGFGVWKNNLFGDTYAYAYGPEGIRFYTRQESVMRRWPQSTPEGPEFSMPTAK